MPPIIVGAAIVGAGAIASSAIVSKGAKKAAETQAQAQQAQITAQQQAAAQEKVEREKAVERKETALVSPELEKFRGTLEERMAGRGLIDVSDLSAPAAVQRRAGLKETEAAIGAAASARGLGRSTIPVSQIGEASQAAERDIAERVAQLQLVKESQKETAISQFGELAKFQRGGEFSVAETMAGNAQRDTQNQFSIAESIANKGATQAAFELKQAEIFAAGLIGVGKSAQQATDDIMGAIENKQRNDILEAIVKRA